VAVSALLAGGLTVMSGQEAALPDGSLMRETYGGMERRYELLVDGLAEQEVPLAVEVAARRYTRAEAETVFADLMDGMAERIRGDNPSLWEVRESLELPTELPGGVRLRWHSSEPELLDYSGKLCGEIAGETDMTLAVQLSVPLAGTEEYFRQDYELDVRLLPPESTAEERYLAGFAKQVRQQEEAQQAQQTVSLPESYEGKRLHYRLKTAGGYGSIFLLGCLLAVLLWARDQEEARKRQQARERELLLDYADLLSKLAVLTGAGLMIRNAWERMVLDYEQALAQGRQRRRAAYEEMRLTFHQMQNGMPESEAYREFGRRCRLQPYLKLSGLLEQNLRTGTKNLRAIFQREMADAMEQRKNLARRLGEEAGTKLLFPLFLMLGIVMVMIMVPAMMTMG